MNKNDMLRWVGGILEFIQLFVIEFLLPFLVPSLSPFFLGGFSMITFISVFLLLLSMHVSGFDVFSMTMYPNSAFYSGACK